MRKAAFVLVIVLVVLAGGWFMLGGEAARTTDHARAAGLRDNVEVIVGREAAEAGGSASPHQAPAAKPRARSRAERDALRERIVQAMQARERTKADDDGDPGAAAAHEPAAGRGEEASPTIPKPPEDAEPTPGNIIDRTGNHAHMVDVMNHELMPLVDECYALARETQPQLAGMLVIDVDMIGDEDLGGVVETVTPGQLNELADEGLIECVRESLLSTTLPPPPEGGREAFSLSLRLEPEEG